MRVGCSQHRGNFTAWKKWQEPHVWDSCRGRLKALAFRAVAYEYQANSLVAQFAYPGEQRVPGAVKAKVSCVQQDESKIATDGANYFRIQIGRRSTCRGNLRAIATDHDASRIDALGRDSLPHVFPQDDNPSRASERPAVQPFPGA